MFPGLEKIKLCRAPSGSGDLAEVHHRKPGDNMQVSTLISMLLVVELHAHTHKYMHKHMHAHKVQLELRLSADAGCLGTQEFAWLNFKIVCTIQDCMHHRSWALRCNGLNLDGVSGPHSP
eukprot:579380-Pelagomonas_calceolata.AAC.5